MGTDDGDDDVDVDVDDNDNDNDNCCGDGDLPAVAVESLHSQEPVPLPVVPEGKGGIVSNSNDSDGGGGWKQRQCSVIWAPLEGDYSNDDASAGMRVDVEGTGSESLNSGTTGSPYVGIVGGEQSGNDVNDPTPRALLARGACPQLPLEVSAMFC